MTFVFTSQAILGAFLIFALRVINMSLDTLRVLFVMRGQRMLTWVLGFFQAMLWVFILTSVLNSLDNLINIVAYAAGYATGNIVGMMIESRLALGHTHMQIISPSRGTAIMEALRDHGYAVTEVPARGKDGMVTLLSCNIRRRQITDAKKTINNVDDEAFVTTSDVRSVQRGFWHA
ncbi:MAG: DUF5698 domain-containing protein [Chloroflexota bacterium]